ncbi:MAG: hypothetical protein M3Q89_07125, partial [Verrucomicrobiota bacterium]|nr:hypothetical protein [Verrucomicrobiota bacterium]
SGPLSSLRQELRWNGVNLAIFPDDHRQTQTTELCPFLPRRRTMRTQSDPSPFGHFALKNSFKAVSVFNLLSKNAASSTILCVLEVAP